MKEIPLTQGQVALVDDEDYERVMRFKWHAQWSRRTKTYYAIHSQHTPHGKNTFMLMHRFILGLEKGDKRQVDHKHHKTLDNRRSELQIVSPHQNCQNRRETKGYVSWPGDRFVAAIVVHGKRKYLGLFRDPQQAHQAYLSAKRIYHPTAPIPEE